MSASVFPETTFREAREKHDFVDRSLFIAELTKGPTFRLIVRPSGFGKSVNLSMLKSFFEIRDEEGRAEARELFKGLAVEGQHADLFAESGSFGRHPVIYTSWKDVKGEDWAEMLRSIRVKLATIYKPFEYLLKVEGLLSDTEKTCMENICNIDAEVSEKVLQDGLKWLTDTLKRHHSGAHCVLLIDDYDTPLNCAYEKGYYEETKQFFIGTCHDLFKAGSSVGIGILMGASCHCDDELRGSIEHFRICSMSDRDYSEYFGTTTDAQPVAEDKEMHKPYAMQSVMST